MSQRQSRRPQGQADQEPLNYGDVFDALGLSSKPDAPRDVQGEGVADQILGQYVPFDVRETTPSPTPTPRTGDLRWTAPSPSTPTPTPSAGAANQTSSVTIGEALEATALSVGDKPVDQGDAAAIQAAEARAAGRDVTQPNGLGATAQAAATHNARVAYDYNMITISDVLSNAVSKLPQDKEVTREDADGVIGAELGYKTYLMTTPGGVADTMATAARVNREHNKP